jgi:Na+/proline symporter
MIITLLLAFFAGYNAANGLPHFITGITGQEHPSPLGASATVNLLEGWTSFIIAGVLWHLGDHPVAAYVAAALGALAINLFHARVWRDNPEFYKNLFRRNA